jgi:hypothetical protein
MDLDTSMTRFSAAEQPTTSEDEPDPRHDCSNHPELSQNLRLYEYNGFNI